MQKYLLICCLFILTWSAKAQTSNSTLNDTTNQVEIIHADAIQGIGRDGAPGTVRELKGNVELKQQQTLLICDTALVFPTENNVQAYGEVYISQNDSVHIFSDSLTYDGNNKKATLYKDVSLSDSTATLFTDLLNYDLNTRIGTYTTGGLIVSDSAELYSQIGYYFVDSSLAFFKDQVRLEHPEYNLTADTLKFNTKTEVAYFNGPTNIFNDKRRIYCEGGYYDTKNNNALFKQDAYYENEDKKAWADAIRYDGVREIYYLESNAHYEDSAQVVDADTIVYNARTDKYFFKGNPKFRTIGGNSNQSVDAVYSYYDASTETAIFRGDVKVVDDNQVLIADNLDYSPKKKEGIAWGNIFWTDTTSNLSINCERIVYSDSTSRLLATGEPLLTTLIDEDTLWLRSDTLRSFKEFPEDTARILIAYNRVRFYSENMQGLCDSLHYFGVDSLFTFYHDPILWADSTQFVADTILMQLKENKVDEVLLVQSSFISNTSDSLFFNQIKGKNIFARFADNKVRTMDVIGNGESVYYLQDEQKAYSGVNKTICSNMLMYFKDNKVQKINFYVQPQAVLYPMGQVIHKTLQLEGFSWQEAARPKNKKDLELERYTQLMTFRPIKAVRLINKAGGKRKNQLQNTDSPESLKSTKSNQQSKPKKKKSIQRPIKSIDKETSKIDDSLETANEIKTKKAKQPSLNSNEIQELKNEANPVVKPNSDSENKAAKTEDETEKPSNTKQVTSNVTTPDKEINNKCKYGPEIKGTFEVIRVKKLVSKSDSQLGYDEFEVSMKFTPDSEEGLSRIQLRRLKKPILFRLDPSGKNYNVGPAYLRQYQIIITKTYNGTLQRIVKGSCSKHLINCLELPNDFSEVNN